MTRGARSLTAGPGVRAMAGTVLGNVPGLLLPFLVTARVEAGRLTDAYFYAFAIAIFVSAVVSLALEATVMPVATQHRRRGRASLLGFARGLAARSVAWTIAGYVVVGALGAASVLVRDNWTAAEQRLCIELIAVFGIYLAATAATSVLAGCLYASDRFFVTRATVAIRSVLPLPLLATSLGAQEILLLSAGAVAAGELVRAGLLARALGDAAHELGDLADPASATLPDLPSVWSTALPYGLAMVLFASNPVIDRIAAGSLSPGAVTTLDLAEKVFYTPVTFLMSSVLLVSGARWAQLALDRPAALTGDFWATVRRSAWLSGAVAVIAVPGALGVGALAHGTLAGVDIGDFSLVLAILMVGFPAAVVTNAGVRLLTVLGRTRVFPIMGVTAFCANVAGSFGGAALLGVSGIALSGTIWRTINLVLFLAFGAAALRRLAPAAPAHAPAPLVPRPTISMEA